MVVQEGGGAPLGDQLRGYPPFTPLHLGTTLSKAQAEANLAQLVAAIPERLHIAASFLQQAHVDPRSALAQEDPRPFLTALWSWGRLRWKTAPQPWRAVRSWRSWRESRRDGEDILLSLLCDIGVILGEIIRGFRPEYHWAMVEGREERKMSYYRQPVLKIDAPRPDCTPSYQVFDIFDVVASSCAETERPGAGYQNEMAALVGECVLGGHEWAWQGFTVVPPMQSWESFLAARAAGAP